MHQTRKPSPQDPPAVHGTYSDNVKVAVKLGIHASVATLIVRVATYCSAEKAEITKGGFTVDAKSIMGLLALSAGLESNLKVSATGEEGRAKKFVFSICKLMEATEPEIAIKNYKEDPSEAIKIGLPHDVLEMLVAAHHKSASLPPVPPAQS